MIVQKFTLGGEFSCTLRVPFILTMTTEDKKMQKRRSAIEPIIGHLKNFCRMGRNYLQGKKGDLINPIISAIGLNLRRITNCLSSWSVLEVT